MTARRWSTLVLVVLFEAWMYDRYAALGAQFHFWLHGLFGATLGLAALTLFRLVRRRLDGRVAPWEAGWAGHLYSAVPDFLFLLFGVLHMFWMDVFALHISVHFVPRPLLTMWALFSLTLLGYGLAMADRRPAALSTLTVAAGGLVLALALASDAPVTVGELRAHDGFALMCPVIGHA